MNYVIALNKEKEKIRKQIREKQQLLRGMKTDCPETHVIKAELRHLTSLLFDRDSLELSQRVSHGSVTFFDCGLIVHVVTSALPVETGWRKSHFKSLFLTFSHLFPSYYLFLFIVFYFFFNRINRIKRIHLFIHLFV